MGEEATTESGGSESSSESSGSESGEEEERYACFLTLSIIASALSCIVGAGSGMDGYHKISLVPRFPDLFEPMFFKKIGAWGQG